MNDVGWLLITTAVSLVAGGAAGWWSAVLRQREARRERVREEVLRWANPILNSVGGLRSRLSNILEQGLYRALSPSRDGDPRPGELSPDWAVSYGYVMPSTLFVFAEYFAWVQLLRERVSLELFESDREHERFRDATWTVTSVLGEWPAEDKTGREEASDDDAPDPLTDVDKQVFALQQRAIGELMIERDHEPPRLLTYRAFLDELQSDPRVAALFEPLRSLVEGVEPGTKRWRRLERTMVALDALERECRAVLHLRDAGSPAP
jgi:hypothetical protein